MDEVGYHMNALPQEVVNKKIPYKNTIMLCIALLVLVLESVNIIITESQLFMPNREIPITIKQEFITMKNYLAFKAPFRMIVAGPSGCGKTTFVRKILLNANEMISPPPDDIIWYYKRWQEWYNDKKYNEHISFIRGMPKNESISCTKSRLIVLDDLFQDINRDIVQLFTCDSHHQNISVVFITQNFFHKSPHQRTISLNASYLAIFKNPRDTSQITHLAQQMYPGNVKFMTDAFRQSTSSAHSYLLVDFTQDADDQTRLRTNIFPGETTTVFIPAH